MDNPVFSPDSAGFWLWRTDSFCSDRTFPSEEAAIKNYEALKEMYQNSGEVSQILPMVPTSIPVDAVQYSRLKGLIPDCENPEKLIRLVCDVIEVLSSVVHEQSNYIYLLENSELPEA